MLYFDHGATSLPKPPAVASAMVEALAICGNPSRGAHAAAMESLRRIAGVRQSIAEYFGMGDSSLVAFTPNATAALNMAIGGITGHIVTTAAEHNSVLRPIYRRGNYTIVPVDRQGSLDLKLLDNAIQGDTEAIVITHGSNVTGNVFDLSSIHKLCAKHGIHLIVDGAQTAGLLPIHMEQMGISALCFSGHKSMYGPQGIGGICLGQGYLPRALVVGGSGYDSFSPTHPSLMPDALEAGTPNTPGIVGLGAGLDYVKSLNGQCYAKADALARYFAKQLSNMPCYIMYGDMAADVRLPIVTMNHMHLPSAELSFQLQDGYGICVRSGAHCAPKIHEALGTHEAGAVRFSFSHLNTKAQVDMALDALKRINRQYTPKG